MCWSEPESVSGLEMISAKNGNILFCTVSSHSPRLFPSPSPCLAPSLSGLFLVRVCFATICLRVEEARINNNSFTQYRWSWCCTDKHRPSLNKHFTLQLAIFSPILNQCFSRAFYRLTQVKEKPLNVIPSVCNWTLLFIDNSRSELSAQCRIVHPIEMCILRR